jgi:hypothetical protein
MKIKKIKKQSVIGARMQARSAAIAGNTPAINMAKMLAASGLVRRVRVDEIELWGIRGHMGKVKKLKDLLFHLRP